MGLFKQPKMSVPTPTPAPEPEPVDPDITDPQAADRVRERRKKAEALANRKKLVVPLGTIGDSSGLSIG